MPRRFDVCNGDADGLCAVLQWRLAHPQPATLVTGLKREIELLERVDAGAGDEVLVCDVSMQRNAAALQRLLQRGALVRYFDHHATGPIPAHPGLQAVVDTSPSLCTSLLMDRHLGGRHRRWALVGAYGDNLRAVAQALADAMGLTSEQNARLRTLGEAINYNAYGECEADVHIAPARLYAFLARHVDPLQAWEHEPVCRELDVRRQADLELARALAPHWQGRAGRVYLLPDAAWARRVSGCLANELASERPELAHAVATPRPSGGLRVSVRAPVASPFGAQQLCSRFGGSGRAGAGGIDALPLQVLERFVAEFSAARWRPDGVD